MLQNLANAAKKKTLVNWKPSERSRNDNINNQAMSHCSDHMVIKYTMSPNRPINKNITSKKPYYTNSTTILYWIDFNPNNQSGNNNKKKQKISIPLLYFHPLFIFNIQPRFYQIAHCIQMCRESQSL